MKKITFFFVFVIFAIMSCTKDESFVEQKNPGFVYVEYKPMPKVVMPEEPIEVRQ